MRSIEYDTVSDKYAQFLRDEVLPDVYAKYNVRKDGYSRGISGSSSGGICAFNVAWWQPDQFSRVLSNIGSFTSIQWHPGEIDGGNVYPFKDPQGAQAEYPCVAAGRLRGSGEQSWKLAAAELANGELAKDDDYDFISVWEWHAQWRARRLRAARGDDLAVARLRSGEDRTTYDMERRKRQAVVPREDL